MELVPTQLDEGGSGASDVGASGNGNASGIDSASGGESNVDIILSNMPG